MVSIQLDKENAQYVPGEILTGTVSWTREIPPRRVVLQLFWYTEGKGKQDVGLVEEQALSARDSIHTEPFQFTLPESPYSFSGKLIALKWALECTVDRKDIDRVEILVSPWVEPVLLDSLPEEKKIVEFM